MRREQESYIWVGIITLAIIAGFAGANFFGFNVVKTVDWTEIEKDKEIVDLTEQSQRQQERIVELEKMQPTDYTFVMIIATIFFILGIFIFTIWQSDEKAKDRKLKEQDLEFKSGKQIRDVIFEIKKLENPYPKDIFLWKNKGKLKFNRGKFNEFNYNSFEKTKEDIIKIIEENYE